MALRTCPICQTTAQPKVDGKRELCSKCGLQLPPPDMEMPDPPDRPRSRTTTARRASQQTRAKSGKIGGFGLSVLLLVGAFVLMSLFYTAVIIVKTQTTTPTTKPAGGTIRWNGPQNDPWGGPRPEFKE